MARKVVLDVDTGTDDAVAIMLAASHPGIELAGVTTVNGNVPVAATTDNTLRVLDLIGRGDIPVHRGLARPVARDGFPGQRHFERDTKGDMHGTTLPLPEAVSRARASSAVDYLVDTLSRADEPVTLVAVGPLSNVATALALRPSLTETVKEVVLMGGAHQYGNVTASAEFNIWADPEAAARVFAAGFPRLTVVPLDATHQALITREDCRALEALGTPAGAAASTIITRRIDAYSVNGGVFAAEESAPVHDAVCIAYLLRPEVLTDVRRVHVAVETSGELTVGRTVVDVRPNATEEPNASFAFGADGRVLVELLLSAFAHDPQTIQTATLD